MNHNHIYTDSVSCEQLKAVDIISKEGHICPTNTLTNKTTNKQTKNIHKVLFIVHSKEKILFNKQLRIAQNNKTATSQLGTLRQM
jgi:hypothetical protein